jgi:hypothetical protein
VSKWQKLLKAGRMWPRQPFQACQARDIEKKLSGAKKNFPMAFRKGITHLIVKKVNAFDGRKKIGRIHLLLTF